MSLVDVLITAKNAEETIAPAIYSILLQSLTDIRIIVVDDGSQDDTKSIVDRIAERDPRVTCVRNPGRGISEAINFAISLSSAPYVARMDADDIAFPDRLERQVQVMQDTPDLVVLGSRVYWFGDRSGYPAMIVGSEACKRALSILSPICNPTAVIRRSSLDQLSYYYDPTLDFAEDYDLFARLALLGRIENLNVPLLMYRIHTKQVSNVYKHHQQRISLKISRTYVSASLGKEEISNSQLISRMVCDSTQLGISNSRQTFRAINRHLKEIASPGSV